MSTGVTILVAFILIVILLLWAVLSDAETPEEKEFWTFLITTSYFVANCSVNEKNKNTIINNFKYIRDHRLFEKRKFIDKFDEIYLMYKKRFFNAN